MSLTITLSDQGSFPLFEKVVGSILGPGTDQLTMIDLCSCEATVTRKLAFKEKTYVDVLDCWDIPGQMDRFVLADVLGDHPCLHKHYDVAYCSDGIEHFTKADGVRLIQRMMWISDKQVLFTPLGDHCVNPTSTDPKEHKSGWLPEHFPGFAAIVAPNYHPSLKIGAFWVWRCADIDTDFLRVKTELGW